MASESDESRERRLEEMLVAKRRELLDRLEGELGLRVALDRLEELLEAVEIGDRSVSVHSEDVALAILEVRRGEFRQIDQALGRLHRKEYGKCAECGDPIEEGRLQALPFTAHCVECKRLGEASATTVVETGEGFRSGFGDVHDRALEANPDPEED